MSATTHGLMWNAIAYGIVVGGSLILALGLYLLAPAWRGLWLPIARLRPVRWGGREVLLTFCIFRGIPSLIITALFTIKFFVPLIGPAPELDAANPEFKLYSMRCFVISSPLILAIVLGLNFALMFALTGARPHHYGLTSGRWPNNFVLGILGFVLATPVVLGIYALLGNVFEISDHHVTLVGQSNPPWWEWTLIGFLVMLAAPLMEEVLLRGILQGWLGRASLMGHIALVTVTAYFGCGDVVHFGSAESNLSFDTNNVLPALFALLLIGGYLVAMMVLARRFQLHEAEIQRWEPNPVDPSELAPPEARRQTRERNEQRLRQWAEANALLAIYGSAMLFAVIHSAWPAPVPLFLLGLVLAWLRYRTQSLVSPIVLHVLFNLVAFIALYGSVTFPAAKNGNEQATAERPSVTNSVPAFQLPLRK